MTATAPSIRETLRTPEATPLIASHFADAIAKGIFMSGGVIFFSRVDEFTPTEVGLAYSLSAVGGLVGTLTLGSLADRLGARRILITMLLIQAGVFCTFPLLHAVAPLYAILFLFGFAQYGGGPAFGALINGAFQPERRVAVRSVLRTAFNVGFSIGTGCAALFVARGVQGLQFVPFLAAALMLASAATCRWIEARERVAPARKKLFGAALDGRFMAIVAANFPLALHSTILLVALPVVLLDLTGFPDWVIPLTVIVNTVCAIIFQIPASRGAETPLGAAQVGRQSAIWLAASCLLVVVLLLVHVPLAVNLLLIGLVVLTVTFAELRQSAASWGMAHELAPEDATAEYIGTFNLYSVAQAIVGPVVLVSAASRFGVGAWLGIGLIVLGAGLVLPGTVRRFMARRSEEAIHE